MLPAWMPHRAFVDRNAHRSELRALGVRLVDDTRRRLIHERRARVVRADRRRDDEAAVGTNAGDAGERRRRSIEPRRARHAKLGEREAASARRRSGPRPRRR